MKLYDNITRDSILHEMNRICGTTDVTYAIRDKVARVNAALDRYFSLAFEADGRWNFDDINESSPPIDAQSIVSGTNRYKVGTFTEKIINVIRIEALNSAGTGIYLIPETMASLDRAGSYRGRDTGRTMASAWSNTFQELYVNAAGGTPTHYIKYGDFIYLRPNPNYSETDGLKIYFNRPASKFDFASVTISQASPGVLTTAIHGLSINDTVMLETDGALPTGLSVDTVYYIKTVPLTTTFTVAATLGGTAINTTSAGSGIHYFVETSKVPGIPLINHPYLAQYASLPYLIEKKLAQAGGVASQIAIAEDSIQEYFATRDQDIRRGLEPNVENNK